MRLSTKLHRQPQLKTRTILMPDEISTEAKQAPPHQRSEDYRSRYANHVYYETSVFDIKSTFGEILQVPGQKGVAAIEQHTAITTSWLEAKLAVIFMALNVAAHEKKFGVVSIPAGVLPSSFQGEE